jgi:hypothetical protein
MVERSTEKTSPVGAESAYLSVKRGRLPRDPAVRVWSPVLGLISPCHARVVMLSKDAHRLPRVLVAGNEYCFLSHPKEAGGKDHAVVI